MGLSVGDPIPLYCQLANYDPAKYVRAFVQKPDGSAVTGSPFTLAACDATGDYRNIIGTMPDVPWIRASYIVYDDAAFTTISDENGGSGETFFSSLESGDILPLFNQLATYDDAKYVRAWVTDAAGAPITGSPFALAVNGLTGNYRNVAAVMPVTPWVSVKYAVYDDAGFTVLSGADGGDSETMFLTETVNPVLLMLLTSNIVAFAGDEECCGAGPVEDLIIKGSARLLSIRLALSPSGNPFILDDASAIEFRMKKADGTVLSVSLADSVEVVNAGGGQLVIQLTEAQTALLATASPSPATIKVTIDAKVTVINLPTQIGVEDAAV